MILITFISVFPGVYLFYISSSRTAVPLLPLQTAAGRRPVVAKLSGGVVFMATSMLLMECFGVMAGILLFIAQLSIAASVTALLLPFSKPSRRQPNASES